MLMFFLAANFVALGQKTENRPVSDFNKVSISGSFDVFLSHSGSEALKIVVNSGNADLTKLITEVDGGVLKIYIKSDRNWDMNWGDVDIYIDYNKINEVKSSGSSDIVTKNTLSSDELSVSSSGSGDMKLDINTKTFTASLSGSCDLDIKGVADDASIHISGSGDISALDLKSRTTSISISGSGDAKVNVSETLEAKISGSGSVSYRGAPGIKNVKISGSGSLQQINN
jgi:Putative auto-transporter adhesin, head GIN domain